jgi:hypothetical protein
MAKAYGGRWSVVGRQSSVVVGKLGAEAGGERRREVVMVAVGSYDAGTRDGYSEVVEWSRVVGAAAASDGCDKVAEGRSPAT